MKKLFAFAALCSMVVLLAGGVAEAQSKKGSSGMARQNVGCGLGTMLFKNNADNSILLQAFQATTNGTSGNQTFGITSGTSECGQPAAFVKNDRVGEFVLANMDNLAKDIAMGRGETLETLAELLQVPAERRAEFYGKLQANFGKIFSSEQVVLAGVVDNIAAVSVN